MSANTAINAIIAIIVGHTLWFIDQRYATGFDGTQLAAIGGNAVAAVGLHMDRAKIGELATKLVDAMESITDRGDKTTDASADGNVALPLDQVTQRESTFRLPADCSKPSIKSKCHQFSKRTPE